MITKKKSLGLAGTYVANPLSPNEKKKVYTIFGIGIVIIVLLVAIAIPTGLLTFNPLPCLSGF